MSPSFNHCLPVNAGIVAASLGALLLLFGAGGCSVEVPGDEQEASAERVAIDGADDGSDLGKVDDGDGSDVESASSCDLPAWYGRTCEQLRWSTDECTACMESSCCEQVNACAGDEACSGLRQCMNDNDCWFFHDSDHYCIRDHCSDCHTEEAEELAVEWTECLYRRCYWECR